jgi:hypothetical protein
MPKETSLLWPKLAKVMKETGSEFSDSSAHAAKRHCFILGRIKLKQERLNGDT